jgi:hypothetical protein
VVKNLSVLQIVQLGPTQPPIQWVPGIILSDIKLTMYEADRSFASSAKLGISGAIPPLRIYCYGVVLKRPQR